MSYDCIIIGGGISGLTAGIKAVKEGMECAVISSGMSSLHYSSGSIDVLGYDSENKSVEEPFVEMKTLVKANQGHPYAKCGVDTVKESLKFISDEISGDEFKLFSAGEKNHRQVTPVGTDKVTFISPESIYKGASADLKQGSKVVIFNFEGFRDFYPEMVAQNLKKTERFAQVEIQTAVIKLEAGVATRNQFEMRATDIAMFFDTDEKLDNLAAQIKELAGSADLAFLPSFIGIKKYSTILNRLEEKSGVILAEVPTPPPSVQGIRLETVLRRKFAALGGVMINADKVVGGKIENGKIQYLETQCNGDFRLKADYFVLASGGFSSGGLKSEQSGMYEPVFNFQLSQNLPQNEWYSGKFLSSKGHPFIKLGVKTNQNLNPYQQDGTEVTNCFCTGAILSDHDSVLEGSGSGVAISTGYCAAKQIIEQFKK